jgi:hypothetical protein
VTHKCKLETGGRGPAGGGREKGKRYSGVKRIKVHYIYTYETNIMKPTKHCLKKEQGRGNGNVMEGVNKNKNFLKKHKITRSDKVAHPSNLNYSGGRDQNDCSLRQVPISTNKLGVAVHTCDSSYTRGHRKKDCGVMLAPGPT